MESNPEFDVTRKFVRVTGEMSNGLIEFEFAVGDPDVCVELVMPRAAFDEFCRREQVEFLNTDKAQPADEVSAEFNWNLHQATHQRFR